MTAKLLAMGAAAACASLMASTTPLSLAGTLPYRFDVIARTDDGYSSLGAPSVNDLGVVAFPGVDASGRGVFYGTPGAVQRLATPGLNVTPSSVDINNAGQIVFQALPPTNPNNFVGIDGVYRANPAGTITPIAEPWSKIEYINGSPVLNNAGLVAFTVHSGPRSELLLGDGTAPVATRTFSSGDVAWPRLNNAGQPTAVKSSSLTGPSLFFDNSDIITRTSPSYTDPQSGLTGTFSVTNADVADGGLVVFAADHGGFNKALFTFVNGVVQKVAGSDNVGDGVVPGINSLGTVAADLPEAGGRPQRIAVFRDGIEHTLISVGDPFEGSTVISLTLMPEGLNDSDQLAFSVTTAAELDNYVVLATVVPEPACVGFLLVMSAGLLARRRSHRR